MSLCLCLGVYVCEGERDRGKMMDGHKIYYKQSNSVFSKQTFSVSFSLFLSCCLASCFALCPFLLHCLYIHDILQVCHHRDCITLSLGKLKDPLKTTKNKCHIYLFGSINKVAGDPPLFICPVYGATSITLSGICVVTVDLYKQSLGIQIGRAVVQLVPLSCWPG